MNASESLDFVNTIRRPRCTIDHKLGPTEWSHRSEGYLKRQIPDHFVQILALAFEGILTRIRYHSIRNIPILSIDEMVMNL